MSMVPSLGYQWNHDLSSKPSIEYNITKGRNSFFAYGSMGLFQGDLSPLSSRSMMDTCILPNLLYGPENWCLSKHSLQMLDSFLGELCKRLLNCKLSQWYSNTPALVVVRQRSARALCLLRKLNFLAISLCCRKQRDLECSDPNFPNWWYRFCLPDSWMQGPWGVLQDKLRLSNTRRYLSTPMRN